MKATFVLMVLALLAVNTVQGLDCIICDNCGELGDQKAVTCDGEDTAITLPPNFPVPEDDGNNTGEDGNGENGNGENGNGENGNGENGNGENGNGGNGNEETEGGKTNKLIHKYLRANEYKCFKYSIKWGAGVLVKRGCTKQTECDKITSQYDKDLVSDCNLCDDNDGCNPASNIKSWALSSIILMAIIKMFL